MDPQEPDAAPRRMDFASTDLVEARDFIDRTYGARLVVERAGPTDRPLVVSLTDAGGFSSGRLELPAVLAFGMRGEGHLVIDTVLRGRVETEPDGTVHRYRRGDVFVANHGDADFELRADGVANHAVGLSSALVAEVAGGDGAWQLLSTDVTPGGAHRWRRVTRFVDDLLADPTSRSSPLVLGQAGRLLAATALAVFPNTAVGAPTATDRRDAHPETVRRAVAYIDDHADLDVSVADIAQAASVTTRAVQLAFRRHLGTTPLAHLRQVRLGYVRAELQAAAPGTVRVSDVAARWGFSGTSRFTEHYRAAFGELPSETLKG